MPHGWQLLSNITLAVQFNRKEAEAAAEGEGMYCTAYNPETDE
jgi:hypothetical protein